MSDAAALARSDWPQFGLAEDMRADIARVLGAGRAAVLATLFAAEGGAPRGLGAQMLIWEGGLSGYLSGGCVEADIALHAQTCLEDGVPHRLVYGRGGPADIMLPCGGRIEVMLERLAPGDRAMDRLLDLTKKRIPAFYSSDGVNRACVAAGEPGPAFREVVRRIYEPCHRLVLFGSDPVVLALATLAAPAGFEIVHARPKGPETAPPLGGLYVTASPIDTLRMFPPDPWTAIVVAMHDEFRDHEALVAALGSGAGYVGLLGSRRRLQEKLARLRAANLDEDAIARLRAPIGIAGLGRGPWQIAVSIQAEIMQTLWASRLHAEGFKSHTLAAE